jgi:hypothetical protein
MIEKKTDSPTIFYISDDDFLYVFLPVEEVKQSTPTATATLRENKTEYPISIYYLGSAYMVIINDNGNLFQTLMTYEQLEKFYSQVLKTSIPIPKPSLRIESNHIVLTYKGVDFYHITEDIETKQELNSIRILQSPPTWLRIIIDNNNKLRLVYAEPYNTYSRIVEINQLVPTLQKLQMSPTAIQTTLHNYISYLARKLTRVHKLRNRTIWLTVEQLQDTIEALFSIKGAS